MSAVERSFPTDSSLGSAPDSAPHSAPGSAPDSAPDGRWQLRTALWCGAAASALLALVTAVRSGAISDRVVALETPHIGADKAAGSGSVLVTIAFVVAALGLLGWWITARAARAGRSWLRWWAAAALVVGVALAVALLLTTEYGRRVYPIEIGLVALLPCLAGLWVCALVWRRRRAGCRGRRRPGKRVAGPKLTQAQRFSQPRANR